MTAKEYIQIASTILDRNSTWIGQSDAKAVGILAFEAGLFTLLSPYFLEIKVILFSTAPANAYQYLLFLVAVVFLFFLGRAGYFALVTLVPKVKPASFSHIFFGNIAQLEEARYISDFQKLTEEEILRETLSQVSMTSIISVRKYERVKQAIISLGVSLVSWMGILLMTA